MKVHRMANDSSLMLVLLLMVMLAIPACPASKTASTTPATFAYPKFWPVKELKVPADAVIATTGPRSAVYQNEDGGGIPGDYKSSTVYFRSKQRPQEYLNQVEQALTAIGYTRDPSVSRDAMKFFSPDRLIMVYISYGPSQAVFLVRIDQSENGMAVQSPP